MEKIFFLLSKYREKVDDSKKYVSTLWTKPKVQILYCSKSLYVRSKCILSRYNLQIPQILISSVRVVSTQAKKGSSGLQIRY